MKINKMNDQKLKESIRRLLNVVVMDMEQNYREKQEIKRIAEKNQQLQERLNPAKVKIIRFINLESK